MRRVESPSASSLLVLDVPRRAAVLPTMSRPPSACTRARELVREVGRVLSALAYLAGHVSSVRESAVGKIFCVVESTTSGSCPLVHSTVKSILFDTRAACCLCFT